MSEPTNDGPHVIIAGFGVAGRFIAELMRQTRHPFVLVELNAETCAAQAALGVPAIHGDISDEAILRRAGVERATILALAIPDYQAALRAAEIANRIRPEIHIIAWAQYKSAGLRALEVGADEVIVAEHAIGMEFYRRIEAFMKAGGALAS